MTGICLRYLGDDKDACLQLGPLPERLKVQWKRFEEADDLLDSCQRAAQGPDDGAGMLESRLLEEAYSPVVLDFSQAAAAASVLSDLKAIDRGIPVIILSEQASLTSFSLGLLDGAEAFFHKPLVSMEPFWEAIERANRRVGRWAAAMERAEVCSLS